MTRPIERPREHTFNYDDRSWHVACAVCPGPGGFTYVCRDGCYDTEDDASRGRSRHLRWHERKGE